MYHYTQLTLARWKQNPAVVRTFRMNVFVLCLLLPTVVQFKNRREDRERKGSIPFHHTGKKRQRRMGVPFLLHEDHLDVSPTRSTFSFASFSGDDRRALERGGWQATIMGTIPDLGSNTF